MKDYSHIITKITSTPWMIEESALKMILEILDAHMSGKMSQEEIRIRLQDADKNGDRHTRIHRNVGILSLSGPMFPKANLMTELSGATSLEQFRKEFRTMLNDDSVDTILLEVDSPGGLADQVTEMAREVWTANQVKPVYAIANTAANSAAYFIASQASKLYATPSGQVGSIGTYTVHTDDSDFLKNMGIKKTVIKTGEFKALGEEPLTSQGKGRIQGYVDAVNAQFVEGVARGRNVTPQHVVDNWGDGFVYTAEQAHENGMVDGVMTLDEVLGNLVEGGGLSAQPVPVAVGSASNTANFALRQSYDADKEHSEPGTGQGGEPTPREPPEKGDPAIEGGWRRDTPPPPYAEDVEQSGGVIVNREQLEALAGRLNLEFSSETSDEELSTLVTERVGEIVVPLNDAVQAAQGERAFVEQYPEQAARIERLEQREREVAAREFADSYTNFADDSHRGFSNVVRDQLESAHQLISERRFSHAALADLVNVMASDSAIVQYGEEGSARGTEVKGSIRPAATTSEVRKQMGDLVSERMKEDGMDWKQALAVVAKENPELAQAYAAS